MPSNPPEGAPCILARLAYQDIAGAIELLESAFGFTERADDRITDQDGKVGLTELDVLDSRIMVGQVGAHGIRSPKEVGGATQALIVYVTDIDAHYARAEIVSAPADMFWGDRRYEARDPEGHIWNFHEHLRDVSREELKQALLALRG